jgi:hypothetical protein
MSHQCPAKYEFEASFGYIVRPNLKIKPNKQKTPNARKQAAITSTLKDHSPFTQ